MTTVLVTGGAGFIGSHVSDLLLDEGHQVVVVDDFSTGSVANLASAFASRRNFQLITLDIRSEELLHVFEGHLPEVVIHLAAQAGVRPSLLDPMTDAAINVLGLINVLECASAIGTRKVVFASSGGTIYGEPDALPVREDLSNARPRSPYGITKKVALDYLRFYRDRRGLDFTALALGNVYGPRQDPYGEAGVIAIFAARMLAGERPTIHGDGSQTRDYIYIRDVVAAFGATIDRGSGALLNIGSGRETSVRQLYEKLARITGFDGEPTYAPAPAGELARIALDSALAYNLLGWRAETSLQDGLERTTLSLRYPIVRVGRNSSAGPPSVLAPK
jgi:UDP-glucose 4-epimerase